MLSREIDNLLLDLCWSLWTELGVAGVIRRHQNCLILVEELILLTSILADQDPRLRDESLDWCSKYHTFISVNRLKTICKKFEAYHGPISKYTTTVNSLGRASWPVYVESSPMRVHLSGKSILRPLESAALINIRARSIFGSGSRADLITFFLIHSKSDYALSEMSEVGYSRNNLAETLEEFYFGGLFDKFLHGNQFRYRLSKNDNLVKILGPVPKYAPAWGVILKLLLPLRAGIMKIENKSENIKTIEICNLLKNLENEIIRLNLNAPKLEEDFGSFLNSFRKWLLDLVGKLSTADFEKNGLLANY